MRSVLLLILGVPIPIVEFIQGLGTDVSVTLKGIWAARWYDLPRPHISEVLVCDPRKNGLLKGGNKSDRIDSRKPAKLFRSNLLRPVSQGEHGVRTLKGLSRSYLTTSEDLVRVMTCLRAACRRWTIP